jgi:hypothetical protein
VVPAHPHHRNDARTAEGGHHGSGRLTSATALRLIAGSSERGSVWRRSKRRCHSPLPVWRHELRDRRWDWETRARTRYTFTLAR